MRKLGFIGLVLAIASVGPGGAEPISDGATTRVSPAATPAGDSTYGSISAGGRYVAFDSTAPLVDEDRNGAEDIYLHDLATGDIALISSGMPGTRAFDPAMTADGNLIAFVQWGAGEGLYVHDRATGWSSLLAAVRGTSPTISPDGRWVLHHNGIWIVLVDRSTGVVSTFRGDSGSLSGTSLLAFVSFMALVPGDTDGVRDVYVRNLVSGEPSLLTGDLDEEAVNPALSADGGTIVFGSLPARQIHPIRLHTQDLESGVRTLISEGAEPYDVPALSADGAVVAFASPGLMFAGTSPAGTDPLTAPGIYVWERSSNRTTLVSVRTGGTPGMWARPFVPELGCFIPVADPVCVPFPPTPIVMGISASNPQISPDGRWVVFDTPQRLADDDTDEAADVYLHDRG